MLILPEGHYAPKVLLAQPREYWSPSLSLPRDGLGNPVVEQYWRLTARINDGHIVWRGRFDDRDDADAFLWAMATGSLQQEPALWRLPTPWWHPDLGELLEYDFSTLRFLTGTSTSNQTDTVPADWNSSSNKIEIISHAGTPVVLAGAGGGGYAQATNVPLTGGTSATFRLAPAGNGNDDAHADWYNGTTLAGSSAGIRGGSNAGGSTTGGAGASTTNAIGSVKFAGGAGGNGDNGAVCCTVPNPGGGGGAAGPHGVGGAGGSAGPLGLGQPANPGLGGTGDNGNTAANANGTQFDASHGSGGGSDGAGGNGGTYGGAAGGGSAVSAAGLIVQTYTPGSGFLFYAPMIFIA